MRWATFDCYGTLVDWNAGLGEQLGRLFGEEHRSRLLGRYHELEPTIQREQPDMSYRAVMATILGRLAQEEQRSLDEEERDALGRSLPGWPVFPDVRDALMEPRRRGWRLAILSNTDRDFIEASMRSIGVPFELSIVASEIGSYKPAPGHWQAFRERTNADPGSHVHVGASEYHDVRPAGGLGIATVWINRLAEQADVTPTRELPDLTALPDVLDELVPAA